MYLFSIILFLLTMVLYTYLYNNKLIYFSYFVIMIFSFFNRKILSNRVNLTEKEKITVLVSDTIIFFVFLILTYNITVNKIISN